MVLGQGTCGGDGREVGKGCMLKEEGRVGTEEGVAQKRNERHTWTRVAGRGHGTRGERRHVTLVFQQCSYFSCVHHALRVGRKVPFPR